MACITVLAAGEVVGQFNVRPTTRGIHPLRQFLSMPNNPDLETNGDDECRAWLNQLFDAKVELAKFVANRRGAGEVTEYLGFLKGSFNLSFRFRFSDGGPDALIRFPKPGHTATSLRDEKIANEVRIMEYISQYTTIPVPHIHSWGLTADSPHQLGPFIIMEYVEGTLLSTILKQPTDSDQEDMVLVLSFSGRSIASGGKLFVQQALVIGARIGSGSI